MPRLLTFGCSFTYGHGLPDCHIPPDMPGNQPSKYAWPQLLADKLKYECINLSAPGSGNFQILMEVLKANYQKDDLVIIAFSYFTRYDFYKMTDKIDKGININFEGSEHKQHILAELGIKYLEEKTFWSNWLAIQHCELFLNSKNIKNYSFMGMPIGAREQQPKLISLNNFISNIPFILKDKALDGEHPGIKSHKLQAELIYDRIKEYELR